MKRSTLSMIVAAMLVSGGSLFAAETTTTTTTWTNEQGTVFREYSSTKKYSPVTDTSIDLKVGSALPSTVEIYSLPPSIKVEQPDRYSYSIVNDRPVVVERTTRKIVRTW